MAVKEQHIIENKVKYIKETKTQAENDRLEKQVNPEEVVKKYLVPRLHGSEVMLDAGIGPGIIERELVKQFPKIQVTGIDNSEVRLERAAENLKDCPNVTLELGDITNLNFPNNSFDFIYSRLVLDHLSHELQVQSIQGFLEMLKEGGKIVLQSLDLGLGRHSPPDSKLKEIKEKLHQTFLLHNYDPNCARGLKGRALEAGATVLETPQIDSYKVFSHPVDPQEFEAYQMTLRGYEVIFTEAFVGKQEGQEAMNYMFNYIQREDTITYSFLMTIMLGNNK
tara:strand:- start:316 stop:1155 length:840 start_codon:yes stop_codon:yes gene_type:complete